MVAELGHPLWMKSPLVILSRVSSGIWEWDRNCGSCGSAGASGVFPCQGHPGAVEKHPQSCLHSIPLTKGEFGIAPSWISLPTAAAANSLFLQLHEPQMAPRMGCGVFGSCFLCYPIWLGPDYPKFLLRCGAQGEVADEGESASTVHLSEFFWGRDEKSSSFIHLLFISTSLTPNSTF